MPKPKSKPARKATRKPARWTPARLMKLAPDSPRPATRDELLARIRTMLTIPDTPTGKPRRP